jgi:carbon storage regulator
MLILARKAGQGIQLGEDIAVYVVEIRGKQVRLGIEAPPHMAVHRTEVYERILEQNRQAAAAPGNLGEALHVWVDSKGVELAESDD